MTQEQMPHRLVLDGRKNLSVTGVTEVVSFDERLVALMTDAGNLMIHGDGLQLKQLDGGQVRVEGSVSALVYEESGPGKSFWGRLFG